MQLQTTELVYAANSLDVYFYDTILCSGGSDNRAIVGHFRGYGVVLSAFDTWRIDYPPSCGNLSMRNALRTTLTSVIIRIWALYWIGVYTGCALALNRPSRSIAVPNNGNSLAFSSLELAKIFGRLADPSPIGSVLATPTAKLTNADCGSKRKWHVVFQREDEELGRSEFAKRLANVQLSWPTYYVANRQPPFLVPEKQRHKFKLKGYLGHVALQPQRLEGATDGNAATDEQALKLIARQPLSDEALDSVFMALSHEEDNLTVNHILAFIKYRSPLLQMVNWEVFIASLPIGPEDVPI